MQQLTASPRQALTNAQVTTLLTGDRVEVVAGLEKLTTGNVLVADISTELVGGSVTRDNYAIVHGSCRLDITTDDLVWGKDRVRPYMVLTNNGVSARFNLGVYVLTSPETKTGTDPIVYEVQGYDLLHLLQSGPGDTYVVTATTTYLTAVQSVISASGVGVPITIDGTLQTTQVPATMVWAVTPQGAPTWIEIINDLLRAINYRDLWVDENGTYRSGPYVAPAVRAVEWTFDTSNPNTIIIGPEITQSSEAWGVPNWWRFVRSRMDTKPIEGAGLYTVTDQTGSPTSINTIGRTVRKVVFLEAADQAALVSQGDRIVAEDKQNILTYDVEVDPLPIAGHFDVVQLLDRGRSDKCQVASWELPLDGSRGRWKLEAVT